MMTGILSIPGFRELVHEHLLKGRFAEALTVLIVRLTLFVTMMHTVA